MSRQHAYKDLAQQKKLGQAIKNLATLIEDGSKPIWKSKIFWTSIATFAGVVIIGVTEGVDKGSVLAGVMAALMIFLRTVTNQSIR